MDAMILFAAAEEATAQGMSFGATVEQFITNVLVWIGFGTLAGLLAKAIMPGRDPGGSVATVIIGIAGSVIGSGTLMFLWDGASGVTLLSPIGFIVATAGAFILLAGYRLLAGRFFREGGSGPYHPYRRYRRRRRAVYDD